MFAVGRRPLALVASAALLAAAACSDSTSTAPNGQLTREEATELARQMGVPFSNPASAASASASADEARLNATGDPFRFSFDVEVRCERGGTARVTATAEGDIDEATESVDIDLQGTYTPNDCGHRVHGVTIWTSPVAGDERSLTATAHVETRNGEPVGIHTATLDGRFRWRASDGREGVCTVDYTATANYTTRRAVVNGNFCGSTISFDGPLTTN
jgi:hypothetical protein